MDRNIFLKSFIEMCEIRKALDFSSFMFEYDNHILFSGYNLKNEISETLLSTSESDRKLYLEYVKDRLEFEIDEEINTARLDKWINEYKLIKNDFPFIDNAKIVDMLNVAIEFSDLEKTELDKISQLQYDFYAHACFLELQKILEFIDDQYNITDGSKKLKWIGKPSQIGFIIGKLAEYGYIDPPTKKDGEINYTKFAELVLENFDVSTTSSSLSKYLNSESEKGQEPARQFEKNNFYLPQSKEVS
jgi:hypothetical protein